MEARSFDFKPFPFGFGILTGLMVPLVMSLMNAGYFFPALDRILSNNESQYSGIDVFYLIWGADPMGYLLLFVFSLVIGFTLVLLTQD